MSAEGSSMPDYLHGGQFSAYDPVHLATYNPEHPLSRALDQARRRHAFHAIAKGAPHHSALQMAGSIIQAGHQAGTSQPGLTSL